MGIATTGEQAAFQRSVRDWAARADLRAPVRAADAAFDPEGPLPTRAGGPDVREIWPAAAELGLIAAGLPVGLGGAGGRLPDAAVALEAAGRALVPGPLLPTVLTAVLLARHARSGPARDLVAVLAAGRVTGAVGLGCEPVTAGRRPDGSIRLDGALPTVLGAGPGAVLMLPARDETGEFWAVVEAAAPGLRLDPLEPFDLSMPAAAIRLHGVVLPTGQVLTTLTGTEVRELAAALAAAEAAGLADWTLHTATEHARVRVQFGRPIGSRQAVKHLCAGMLARREEAVAVGWDAARAFAVAFDAAPGDGPSPSPGAPPPYAGPVSLAAAVAAAAALDAAVENAKDCIQVLGGIGFTWEHDAHLYLRRALSLRQWLGGSASWRARAAELTRDGVRRPLTSPLGESDRSAPDTRAAAELRGRVKAVLADLAGRPAADPASRARLADSGYLVAHWPPPYGVGASAREQLVIDDELRRAGVVRPDLGIGAWAVPTIVEHGTPAQRERFVRSSLRGELAWCQLFSEPEAGSDLASLRTRAVRVEGGWSLTGQKVWTSHARSAHWAICLARTDPDAAPHAGITYFLLDLATPGIEARPLREITGEALFNEVFLQDVFVPDDCVVGPVNGGWRLARGTLAAERVSMGGGSALGRELEGLLALKERDVLSPDRLGALVARGSAVSLIGLLSLARALAAENDAAAAPGPESSVVKLLGTRHRQDVAETAYEVIGEAGLTVGPDSAAVQHLLLLSRCLTIAGGTTQILLNVVAERLLGLPRDQSGPAPTAARPVASGATS